MKVFKASFNLYGKEYRENLNYFTELEEKGLVKILKCYPVKNQVVIQYEANEEY